MHRLFSLVLPHLRAKKTSTMSLVENSGPSLRLRKPKRLLDGKNEKPEWLAMNAAISSIKGICRQVKGHVPSLHQGSYFHNGVVEVQGQSRQPQGDPSSCILWTCGAIKPNWWKVFLLSCIEYVHVPVVQPTRFQDSNSDWLTQICPVWPCRLAPFVFVGQCANLLATLYILPISITWEPWRVA